MEMLASILIGTSGLAVAAVVSLVLTMGRSALAPNAASPIRRYATATLLLQIGHFFEELATRFYVAFPSLLDLATWSATFFVIFNAVWVAIWVLAIVWLPSRRRLLTFPIWFLGIAAVANGAVHPALALATEGYFPGLWTSLLVGCAGFLLIRQMLAATDRYIGRRGPRPAGDEGRADVSR